MHSIIHAVIALEQCAKLRQDFYLKNSETVQVIAFFKKKVLTQMGTLFESYYCVDYAITFNKMAKHNNYNNNISRERSMDTVLVSLFLTLMRYVLTG